MKQQIHLVCNAHLDPVWQWKWPAGLAEALSTFRIAADFCENDGDFVFNHNEALLYRWVEEYDPALFARIQRLVAAGKWHIMGGWFLQPDCLMSSGESLQRQIRFGREYFQEKFGVTPTVAVNVDPFGHDQGLVQLMAKNGYTGYIITRPGVRPERQLPNEFMWEGYNGYALPVHRTSMGYSSLMGKSVEKIEWILNNEPQKERMLIFWGIGNHGGGPSKIDLEQIAAWKEKNADKYEVLHSTPEDYFAGMNLDELPRFGGDLTPIMVGCYSSMRRIKELHAKLENKLLQTEKICAAAHHQIGLPIPTRVLAEAEETLLFNEFHDILPGSCIREAETAALQSFGGAIESLEKAQVKAFIKLAESYPAPPAGTIPIFVYNPHPWAVESVNEADFMLADQNWDPYWTDYDIYDGDTQIPSQLVKENSTIPLDWSKQMAFVVNLPPFTMKRLIARPKKLPEKPVVAQPEGDLIVMESGRSSVAIDRSTGWIDSYVADGKTVLKEQAGQLRIIEDDEDPWGMRVSSFPKDIGSFTLATAEQAGRIAGLPHDLTPVRLIEDGAVRSAVEAVFVYEQSHAVITYTLEQATGKLAVHIRMSFQQANRMVKWQLPVAYENTNCFGQGVFGHRELFNDGRENVAQRWLAVTNGDGCFTLCNSSGVYASSFQDGVLYQTLVRTPSYCAHPIEERQILPSDRCLPRIDIGQFDYDFLLDGGAHATRMAQVERESQIFCEKPVAMSLFTAGKGADAHDPLITLDNPVVTMTSCRQTAAGMAVCLFNQTEQEQAVCAAAITGNKQALTLRPMEFTEIVL